MSCAINKDLIKKRILEKNTLVAVMSMPDELFYPVGIITCIMVFRAGVPHNKNIESWFGFWKDDGFEKTKHNGRIDKNSKWIEIKQKWLDMFMNKKEIISLSVRQKVDWDSEWCAEAYMKTDYSTINEEDFTKEMKKYILFTNLNSK
jgi:type I restriction-modification system DNA methylase subunit